MPQLLVLLPPAPISDALRSLGTYDRLGPHVTLKAQPGLEDDRRSEWLPPLRRVIAGFEPFAVQLGPVGTFGDDVVFLEVIAPQVHALHRLLVDTVDPPHQQAVSHFELADWHPHLTLRQGSAVNVDELRAAVARLGPLPPFTVEEVWLCRQDAAGACVLDEPLSLRRPRRP